MPTVKGPITFQSGKEIPSKVLAVIGEIPLPFSATNFTYSNRKMDGKNFKFSDGKRMSAKNGRLEKKLLWL